jgi:CRISPR-associated endonuclease/helicase Cas3
MGSNLKTLKSHPDKFLLNHIQGVRENVKRLTNSEIADLVAVFHDLGKMNPNFQAKVNNEKPNDYANHSYLSAYVFFCAFFSDRVKILKRLLRNEDLSNNDLIALIVLIAKHHGNLPDFTPFTPIDYSGAGAAILSKEEVRSLFQFLEKDVDIPFEEYVKYFQEVDEFRSILINSKVQKCFLDNLIFYGSRNQNPLDFFLNYQFAFASVIQADKADAGKIGNIIIEQQDDVSEFSRIFKSQLNSYLCKLKQDTELNKLRTIIRENAVENIHQGLYEDECVFELTAPTGSGKTLMMLSLASEIIQEKGSKRIIYALPFLSITEQVESEVLKIFKGYEKFVQRIDSKSGSNRFEKLQEQLENNSDREIIAKMNVLEFQENTFAYPFIITTFVRFFETLLSNKNAELLKLPNFSNCIFLLDEIQSLPPRLYGFFVGYLKKFCQKFNSFAIVSTATQPNFNLPEDNTEAKKFFSDYTVPKPLLPLKYFDYQLFNRYHIHYDKSCIDLDELTNKLINENSSTLVILNTIDDTKELYKKLKEYYLSDELLLLYNRKNEMCRILKRNVHKNTCDKNI